MEIEHKLVGAQVKYGYIWWGEKNKEKYEEIFPEGTFTIKIKGKEIPNRKIDKKSKRLCVNQGLMKRNFNKNDIVKISRKMNSNEIIIYK